MFFAFAFNAFLAIIVTYKLSNEFEKLYNNKKSDTEMALNAENVDLGMKNTHKIIIIYYITDLRVYLCNIQYTISLFAVMLLKKESYQLAF